MSVCRSWPPWSNGQRLSGRAQEALPRLRSMVNGAQISQIYSVLAAAYHDAGDAAGMPGESWLRGQQGRAYAEYAGSWVP